MEQNGNYMEHDGKFIEVDGNFMEHGQNFKKKDGSFMEHDGRKRDGSKLFQV